MMTSKNWEDLRNITAKTITDATDKELNDLYHRITRPFGDSAMDKASYGMFEEEWINEAVTKVYWMVTAEMDKRYQEENEPEIRAYFDKYFKGKTWEEIKSDAELYDNWGYYSDWHKDVFGYRPHDIVCGVYVSPYWYSLTNTPTKGVFYFAHFTVDKQINIC